MKILQLRPIRKKTLEDRIRAKIKKIFKKKEKK
jgi:hypothetical protein